MRKIREGGALRHHEESGENAARVINFRSKAGMEMVQVGILIAIAIGIGLIFKTEITDFVNGTFDGLSAFN